MREIKFNYLVKRDNGYSFNKTFFLCDIENGDVLHWIKVNNINKKDIHKRQYIGLKDKNKKEIYEGDIVKGTWKGKMLIKDILGTVDFDEGMFGLENQNDGDAYSLNRLIVKIIGNKYENKDLIK